MFVHVINGSPPNAWEARFLESLQVHRGIALVRVGLPGVPGDAVGVVLITSHGVAAVDVRGASFPVGRRAPLVEDWTVPELDRSGFTLSVPDPSAARRAQALESLFAGAGLSCGGVRPWLVVDGAGAQVVLGGAPRQFDDVSVTLLTDDTYRTLVSQMSHALSAEMARGVLRSLGRITELPESVLSKEGFQTSVEPVPRETGPAGDDAPSRPEQPPSAGSPHVKPNAGADRAGPRSQASQAGERTPVATWLAPLLGVACLAWLFQSAPRFGQEHAEEGSWTVGSPSRPVMEPPPAEHGRLDLPVPGPVRESPFAENTPQSEPALRDAESAVQPSPAQAPLAPVSPPPAMTTIPDLGQGHGAGTVDSTPDAALPYNVPRATRDEDLARRLARADAALALDRPAVSQLRDALVDYAYALSQAPASQAARRGLDAAAARLLGLAVDAVQTAADMGAVDGLVDEVLQALQRADLSGGPMVRRAASRFVDASLERVGAVLRAPSFQGLAEAAETLAREHLVAERLLGEVPARHAQLVAGLRRFDRVVAPAVGWSSLIETPGSFELWLEDPQVVALASDGRTYPAGSRTLRTRSVRFRSTDGRDKVVYLKATD